ncbi:MAG: hypothetical protein U1E78_05835 [Gammaproteobacteria bacterium]
MAHPENMIRMKELNKMLFNVWGAKEEYIVIDYFAMRRLKFHISNDISCASDAIEIGDFFDSEAVLSAADKKLIQKRIQLLKESTIKPKLIYLSGHKELDRLWTQTFPELEYISMSNYEVVIEDQFDPSHLDPSSKKILIRNVKQIDFTQQALNTTKFIEIENCHVTSEFLNSILILKSLEVLCFRDCTFGDIEKGELMKHLSIRGIYFSDCTLASHKFSEIIRVAPRLKKLLMEGTILDYGSAEAVESEFDKEDFQELVQIVFEGLDGEEDDANSFIQLMKLLKYRIEMITDLKIRNIDLNGLEVSSQLLKFRRLKRLIANDCYLDHKTIEYISALSKINFLSIVDSPSTDFSLILSLVRLPNLRCLMLSENSFYENEDKEFFFVSCNQSDLDKLFYYDENKYNNYKARKTTLATEFTGNGDVNTSLDQNPTQFNIKRSLYSKNEYHPDARLIRQRVYTRLETEPSVIRNIAPFRLEVGEYKFEKIEEVKPLSICELQTIWRKETDQVYYGKIELLLSSKPTPLPSVSATDNLIAIAFDDNEVTVMSGYSSAHNLTYLWSEVQLHIEIHFLLKNEFQFDKPLTQLPKEIIQEILYMKEFTAKSFQMTDSMSRGEDILNAMYLQKTGACRHRTAMFMHRLKNSYPVRYVENELHAFPEIYCNNEWHALDLGGYPAEVNIENDELITSTDIKSESSKKADSSLNLDDRFVTWKFDNKQRDEADFIKSLLVKTNRKVLIDLDDPIAISKLAVYILKLSKDLDRPVYYIQSPRDLNCSGRWLSLDKEYKGKINSGPGGDLYEFLVHHRSPILLVNYASFNDNDIVKYNQLIDSIPLADGIAVPPETLILGLYSSTSPSAYQGGDFYSRFYKVVKISSSLESFSEVSSELLRRFQNHSSSDTTFIDLHQSFDWERILLGSWLFTSGSYEFQKGALLEALESNTEAITLHNAPWSHPKFVAFWEHAFLYNEFKINGRAFSIPSALKLYTSEGYDWKGLKMVITNSSSMDSTAYVLNSQTFPSFFRIYECDNGSLMEKKGVLSQNANREIILIVTEYMTSSQWSQLLSSCSRYNVRLILHRSRDVELPFELESKTTDRFALDPNVELILSDDIEASLSYLSLTAEHLMVDVSELEFIDVIERISISWIDDSNFAAQRKMSDLWKCLLEGQTLILKGRFSHHLINELERYCIKDSIDSLNSNNNIGKLILISQPNSRFRNWEHVVHEISREFKATLLSKHYSENEIAIISKFIDRPYIQIKNMIEFSKRYSNVNPEDLWRGLEVIESEQQTNARHFDLNQIEASLRLRTKMVFEALSFRPIVFLAGPTGAGKSSFVESLKNNPDYKIYYEMNSLKDWASDRTLNVSKILFIDEANIPNSGYNMFEGLYNNKKFILIEGVLYTLDNHFMILAGNPCSNLGGRSVPELIRNHGNSVVFHPIPPIYLVYKIVIPLFASSRIDQNAIKIIAALFLKFYTDVTALSTKKVLITARELKTMALQTLTSIVRSSSAQIQPVEAALKSIYIIAKSILSKSLFSKLRNLFNFDNVSFGTKVDIFKDYVVPVSRMHVSQAIQNLLDVREYIRQDQAKAEWYIGSLTGLILEGEPGEGKSQMLKSILSQRGYLEVKQNEIPTDEKYYYYISASQSPKERNELLMQALENGALVLIDEWNSLGISEKCINKILDLKIDNRKPRQSTFMLLCTQNPAKKLPGRTALTEPLKHRVIYLKLKSYDREECLQVLQAKDPNNIVSPDIKFNLVEEYFRCKNYAEKNSYTPLPVFRNLESVFLKMQRHICQSESECSKKRSRAHINAENPPSPKISKYY